jgi:hypothetical protein
MGKVQAILLKKTVQWNEAIKLGVRVAVRLEDVAVDEVDTAGEVQVGDEAEVKGVIHPVQANPTTVISGLRQLLMYM